MLVLFVMVCISLFLFLFLIENKIGCNRSPIIGIRYKCLECLDYDLCESCADRQLIHAHHVMAKIRTPHQVYFFIFVYLIETIK
jgi:hypothetical protein